MFDLSFAVKCKCLYIKELPLNPTSTELRLCRAKQPAQVQVWR